MKDKAFEKALDWTKKKGFQNIKANTDIDDLETPSKFTLVGRDEPVIPDITGVINGRKSYIEIAEKNGNKEEIVSKWKLLYTLAERKGGKLYILALKGHKSFTDKIVLQYNLTNTTVIYLK